MAHVAHEVVDVTNGVLALLHGGVEQVPHRLLLQRRDCPPGEQGDGPALRPRDAEREPLLFGVRLVLQRCPALQAVLTVADQFLQHLRGAGGSELAASNLHAGIEETLKAQACTNAA